MRKKKLFPLWAAFLIDFLVFAAFFGIFMRVHYVGSQINGDLVVQGEFTNPNQNTDDRVIPNGTADTPITMSKTDLDTSGDFGGRFPERFRQDSYSSLFNSDSVIRSYLASMGYDFYDANGKGRFIGLYQSHNIFLSVLQVDTEIASLASGNLHKERYYIYDIYVRYIDNLYTNATGIRAEFEDLVEDAGNQDFAVGIPIAAVNGDYWGNTSHCLLAVRNGKIIGDPHYDYIYSDLCVLYFDGTVETYKPDAFNWKAIEAKVPYQIWNFGPGLLDENGVSYGSYSNDSYDHNVVDARHPRTIFGYYEPGHYGFVVIDGRSDESDGMTLPEAALILEDMGCKQAYNMDGGDSTYAYFGGNIVRQNWGRAENDNARLIYDIICVGETQTTKKKGQS